MSQADVIHSIDHDGTTALDRASPASLIDVAGRQRMLNQSLCKARLAKQMGVDIEFEPLYFLLKRTAEALARGGVIETGSGVKLLAPAPANVEIRLTAEDQLDLLSTLQLFDLQRATSPAVALADAAKFHDAAQATVSALAAWSTSIDQVRKYEIEQLITRLDQVAWHAETGVADVQRACESLLGVGTNLRTLSCESKDQSTSLAKASTDISNLAVAGAGNAREMAASVNQMEHIAKRTVDAANDGATSVSTALKQVEAVNQKAQDITHAIRDVALVAESTRLLALNASIEAARAGDAGKGFGVVAHEVKGLANTAHATAVKIEETTNHLAASIQKMTEEAASLERAMHQIRDLATETAAAVDQQATTTRAVAQTAEQLESEGDRLQRHASEGQRIGEGTLSSAESLSTGLDDLARTADQLREVVTEGRRRAQPFTTQS